MFQNLVSIDLIDCLSTVFNNNSHKDLFIEQHKALCVACTKANHKPSNFLTKIAPVLKEMKFHSSDFEGELNFAITLYKLGIYNEKLVKYVLNSPSAPGDEGLDILFKILYGTKQMDEHTREMNMDNFIGDIEDCIGRNKILKNVPISGNTTVSFVLKFNTEMNDFVEMKRTSSLQENLRCRENELM